MTLTVETVGPQRKDRQLSLWMLHYKLSCCVVSCSSGYLSFRLPDAHDEHKSYIYKKEELLVLCLLSLYLSLSLSSSLSSPHFYNGHNKYP